MTLVEMLVTVAVLVIMMTILVQIFQAATGAMSAAKTYQQLDDHLRQLNNVIRSDLEGVTAKFTPPLDPAMNLGYFEYGENEFADIQGEDCDDYFRFTAKAPAGMPFTGRFWALYPNGYNSNNFSHQPQPITITSDYAEIIYFLRNGNLYRRVLLIAPEMQPALELVQAAPGQYRILPTNGGYAFYPANLGGNPMNASGNPVSWQGVNDLSAHPSPVGSTTTGGTVNRIILNTLGDLTNRENRFAYPRFASDFFSATKPGAGQDGLADDTNGDNVPDLYPSLYPHVFNTGLIMSNPTGNAVIANAAKLLAFPYIFPGAYSQPQNLVSGYQTGWIHSPTPNAGPNSITFDSNPSTYLLEMNHNPLEEGDNLSIPTQTSQYQTWWGFPTWRETLSQYWTDPAMPVWMGRSQPPGLTYGTWSGSAFSLFNMSNGYVVASNPNLLPPMVSSWTSGGNTFDYPGFRNHSQLYSDGLGVSSEFLNTTLWSLSWEDDLILTNVRSFDVKIYDQSLGNYADLGWGDDIRILQNAADGNYGNATLPQAPFLHGSYDELTRSYNSYTPMKYGNNQYYNLLTQTFAHEGRIPPLTTDMRVDAQFGLGTYTGYAYNGNIGDNAPGVVRLRRVWDSWSTDYSQAPAKGFIKANGFPIGPPFSPPIYPSYPAPYPAPMRGIQIQIRVADPTNQRVKQLTIRQDFTDKL